MIPKTMRPPSPHELLLASGGEGVVVALATTTGGGRGHGPRSAKLALGTGEHADTISARRWRRNDDAGSSSGTVAGTAPTRLGRKRDRRTLPALATARGGGRQCGDAVLINTGSTGTRALDLVT